MKNIFSQSNFRFINTLSIMAICFVQFNTHADIPINYYGTVNTTSSADLRSTLHEIIDDHQRFPYTSSSTDTWDILEQADQNPDDVARIIDVYKNASYLKEGGGNSFYNREHTWPKSYGFPNDGSTNYPYTDTHHLFLSDSGYNSSRSNKPYADCNSGCSEKVTEFNNVRGGGVNDSNWTTGSFESGSWETWDDRKGDVARALMYMAVRYEGGTHGVTGVNEPNLILTDDRALIGASNTGSNGTVAYMGLRATLIAWHEADPVDDFERRHTDVVYSFQGNRNPFIDHPEYAACVFENVCNGTSDITPPVIPANLVGTDGVGFIRLEWNQNTEIDLSGYNVYRSQTSGGSFSKINPLVVSTDFYSDPNVTPLITYYYVVTAVDTSGNESGMSNEGFGTASEVIVVIPDAWINEFHYDNTSTDVGEFIEIAAASGTDLNGWSLVLYNGNGGSVYKTVNLSGVVSNEQNGYGAISFFIAGIQNGGPDGIALVDNIGTVLEFISYEGSFSALGGVADDMFSTDIGVSESGTTTIGSSLQLSGVGFDNFTWSLNNNSAGSLNLNQSFGGANQLPTASFSYSCQDLVCNFDASNSTDPDGTIASYNWELGDGNLDTGAGLSYSYLSAVSYNVVLTVIDDLGASASSTQIVTVSESTQESFFENTTVMPVPDRSSIESVISVSRTGLAGTVDIFVDVTHTNRGQIEIELQAPNGTTYLLKAKNKRDSTSDVLETYTVNVSGDASGGWVLVVKDKTRRITGQLNRWSIQF